MLNSVPPFLRFGFPPPPLDCDVCQRLEQLRKRLDCLELPGRSVDSVATGSVSIGRHYGGRPQRSISEPVGRGDRVVLTEVFDAYEEERLLLLDEELFRRDGDAGDASLFGEQVVDDDRSPVAPVGTSDTTGRPHDTRERIPRGESSSTLVVSERRTRRRPQTYSQHAIRRAGEKLHASTLQREAFVRAALEERAAPNSPVILPVEHWAAQFLAVFSSSSSKLEVSPHRSRRCAEFVRQCAALAGVSKKRKTEASYRDKGCQPLYMRENLEFRKCEEADGTGVFVGGVLPGTAADHALDRDGVEIPARNSNIGTGQTLIREECVFETVPTVEAQMSDAAFREELGQLGKLLNPEETTDMQFLCAVCLSNARSYPRVERGCEQESCGGVDANGDMIHLQGQDGGGGGIMDRVPVWGSRENTAVVGRTSIIVALAQEWLLEDARGDSSPVMSPKLAEIFSFLLRDHEQLGRPEELDSADRNNLFGHLQGVFETNAITVPRADGNLNKPLGRGLFARIARVNHSCRPNCVVEVMRAPSSPVVACLRAVRPIKPGEELTISYVDPGQPYGIRQELCRKGYNFRLALPEVGMSPSQVGEDDVFRAFLLAEDACDDDEGFEFDGPQPQRGQRKESRREGKKITDVHALVSHCSGVTEQEMSFAEEIVQTWFSADGARLTDRRNLLERILALMKHCGVWNHAAAARCYLQLWRLHDNKSSSSWASSMLEEASSQTALELQVGLDCLSADEAESNLEVLVEQLLMIGGSEDIAANEQRFIRDVVAQLLCRYAR